MSDRSSSPSRRPVALLGVVLMLGVAAWLWFAEVDDPAMPGPTSPAPAAPAAAGDATAGQAPGAAAEVASRERTQPTGGAEPAAGGDGKSAVSDRSRPVDGEDAEPAAHVRGRVVDARGAPIAGATVYQQVDVRQKMGNVPIAIRGIDRFLGRMNVDGVKTAADGTFDLGLDEAGAFLVAARHGDYVRAEQRGTVEAGGVVDGIVLTLRDGATISGVVTGRPEDAGPVDVQVAARERSSGLGGAADALAGALEFDVSAVLDAAVGKLGERTVRAADDGSFTVRGLDPDFDYDVWGTRPGTSDLAGEICTERVDVRAGAAGIELPWREHLIVVLRVQDERGEPLESLDVDYGLERQIKFAGIGVPVTPTRSHELDEFTDGLVTLTGLEIEEDQQRGKLTVSVRAAGKKTWRREGVDVPRSGRVDLGIATLTPAPVLRVTVVEAATRAPVAGARVELRRPVEDDGEGDTNSGGGSVRISTSVNTDSNSGPDVRMAGDDATIEAETDADGRCELTCFDEPSGVLVVSSDRFAPAAVDVAIPGIGTFDHEVALTVGATVEILVVDGHGAPLVDARVAHEAPDAPSADRYDLPPGTDANGRMTVERLAPGRHRFRLLEDDASSVAGALRVAINTSSLGDPTSWTEVDLVDGQTATVRLERPLTATITGTVTLDGAPLDGARVALLSGPGGGDADAEREVAAAFARGFLSQLVGGGDDDGGTTDADGAFTLRKVPVGVHRLQVVHTSRAMPAVVPVTIVEGENVRDVVLRDTVLAGRVVDANGEPVRRAKVSVRRGGDGAGAAAEAALADASSEIAGLFGGGGGTTTVSWRTDADGRFEVHGIATGVPLAVTAEARLKVRAKVDVPAVLDGERREGVELRLRDAGRIRVTAGSVDGAVSVDVVWDGPDDGAPERRKRSALLKNGRTTIDGLAPGRWRVELDGVDVSAAPQTVEVVAGESHAAAW